MIDHLIFNKLKWFNVNPDNDRATFGGKTWHAIPKAIYLTDNNADASGSSYYAKGKTLTDVIGETGDCWIVSQGAGYTADYIYKSKAQPIWGGKASLIRLYQAFKSLFLTREVA